MEKNELLAAWTYRRGELLRQRLIQRAGGMVLLGDMLFAVYRSLSKPKEEELLVTSAKIITAKKTWVLLDEKRQLTRVRLKLRSHGATLVFNGHEKKTQKNHPFTIILPIPVKEMALAQSIYHYFLHGLTTADKLPNLSNSLAT